MGYDIIGDIHGHASKLTALLRKLGYRETLGAWRHNDRSAIFVGDFIDRGSEGVDDAGSALAVMGNHELNAIAWHTPDERSPGEYLRPRHTDPWGARNRSQHQAFLAQVDNDPALHADLVSWFMSLPLWLDLPGLRVIHACWHDDYIDWLGGHLRDGRFLTPELLVEATTEPEDPAEKDSPTPSVFKAVETLLKGIEIQLPPPHSFEDKDGHVRHRIRTRWWDPDAHSYRQVALGDEIASQLPDEPAPAKARASSALTKPTFFGHYWMNGAPTVLHSRAACVDYSAGKGGSLVAYQWDGESELTSTKFVSV